MIVGAVPVSADAGVIVMKLVAPRAFWKVTVATVAVAFATTLTLLALPTFVSKAEAGLERCLESCWVVAVGDVPCRLAAGGGGELQVKRAAGDEAAERDGLDRIGRAKPSGPPGCRWRR